MSIASELTRIETAKSNLKTSIEGKGVTVPSTATLDAYPTYVDSIQQGGVSSWIEIDDITPFKRLNRMTSYIKSVDIPTNITTIVGGAFQYCTSLPSITIPSGVTNIGESTFLNCTNLTAVTIPSDSNITSIGESAFNGCVRLQSIDIPSGVTSIGDNAFYGSKLTAITIPSGVTSISVGVFKSCSALQSVTIGNGVTSIGSNAFSFCSSLTAITIPSGVTSIDSDAFEYCSSLTAITIPSGVTSIGGSAFYNCRSLQSITVNAVTPPTLGSSAFISTNDCPIYVPEESVDTYKAASRWSTYASRIQAIPTPSTWELVTESKTNATKIKADYSLISSDYDYTYDSYLLEGGSVDAAVYYANSAFIEDMSNTQGVDFSDYIDMVIVISNSDASHLLTLEDGVEYDLVSELGSSVNVQANSSDSDRSHYLYAK